MKVLVVGSGGREHAVITALSRSEEIDHIYCAPGNGGIAALAECVAIKATPRRSPHVLWQSVSPSRQQMSKP